MLLISGINFSPAQVGINTSTPHPSAMLDIESSDSGVLIPRIALTSPSDNTTISAGNTESLLVYNTSTNGGMSPGFYYWDKNEVWIRIQTSNDIEKPYVTGDLKHSFQTADHQGWYLLNGRELSSLPVNARDAANSLGLSSNLPDAANRVLKAKMGSENIGSTTGNNTITLKANNIPEVTGTTSTNGAHRHRSTDRGDTFEVLDEIQRSLFGGSTVLNDGTSTTNPQLTSLAGNHNHTVTVGNATPAAIDNTPASLVTNVFIYLGD